MIIRVAVEKEFIIQYDIEIEYKGSNFACKHPLAARFRFETWPYLLIATPFRQTVEFEKSELIASFAKATLLEAAGLLPAASSFVIFTDKLNTA